MSAIKDGGPAFPESYIGSDAPHEGIGGGMTLRDYFAAKVMQGIVSTIDSEEGYWRLREHANRCSMNVSQWIARDAYKQADAMLEAREVQS